MQSARRAWKPGPGAPTFCPVLLFLLLLLLLSLVSVAVAQNKQYPQSRPDLAGDYCRTRPNEQCCPGRDDECTVPILDTLCYCDVFCNRTATDCCPDFWGHCIGIPPPTTQIKNNCQHEDSLHAPGKEIHVNCNNCTCVLAEVKQEYNWKCTQKVCLIQQDVLDRVNGGNYGWRATNYPFFWGWSLEQGLTLRLGTFLPVDPVKSMTSVRVHIDGQFPRNFDARTEWPGLVHDVADQGNCAASWAFSTTAVASDRLSIHSKGHIREQLSPQNLISCNRDHQQKGCAGGHLDRAWWHMRNFGVVSESCYPYRSGQTNRSEECLLTESHSSSSRTKSCPGGTGLSSRVFKASPPYRIAPGEQEIMKEILDNGPVQATMKVKADFFMYKGGVYDASVPASQSPDGLESGYHSVRILGWGVEQHQGRDLKYWLCANSWGRKWGEDGYFRILRGVNECDIESFVLGVWGKVNGRSIVNRRRGSVRQIRHLRHRHSGRRRQE